MSTTLFVSTFLALTLPSASEVLLIVVGCPFRQETLLAEAKRWAREDRN